MHTVLGPVPRTVKPNHLVKARAAFGMTVVLPLTRRWKISAENSAIDSVFGHFLEIGTLCLLSNFWGNTTFSGGCSHLLSPKVSRIRDRFKKIYGTRPEI